MNTFKTVCMWIVIVFVGIYFLKGFFWCGGCATEPFNPQKMSQVPVVPQTPIWVVPQKTAPIVIYESGEAPSAQPAARPRLNFPVRIPSWDEGWEPYAAWRARQPCEPDRPQ